jgi:hypothetical protein
MENEDEMTFELKINDATVMRFAAYRFTRDRDRLAGIARLGAVTKGFSGIRR